MDDPNITMEEYIKLEAEKAHTHDFPAIVYKDALVSDHEISSKPTLEDGERMWHSIEKGSYERPLITDPDDTRVKILEPLSKMTETKKKQYIADLKVMNYLLQAIPNDIYNLVDACKNAKDIWERIRRLMFGSDVTSQNNESNQIVQRVLRTKSNQGKTNVQCYNCNEKGHYARDCSKPRVCDAKYFREQMLLAMKDEAESNLNKENDFMLDNSFGYDTLEELTVAVIMMARIQPADDNAVKEPKEDAKAFSEVNASNKMITNRFHEHKNHGKRKTVINTSADDQIDSSIIFDDPYVENNGGTDDHDLSAHDPYHDVKILAYNALTEAKNQKQLNNDLKKQKMLLQ
ncbi:copia protein [Tanacetum coccineum]|uniref:Copia protein n=1 Tax=Tanacetum coccineum TaxID=301880 RepID=A0ABQ5I7V0_9ASTR